MITISFTTYASLISVTIGQSLRGVFHGQIWNAFISRYVCYSWGCGWCGCRYRGRSTTSIGGREGLTLVRGGNGVGATSEYLIAIDTIDGDEVDDVRLSLGSNSLTIYRFFFPLVPFSLESCDKGRGGSAPPDDIYI